MKKNSKPNRFFIELLIHRDRLRAQNRRLVVRLRDFSAENFAGHRWISRQWRNPDLALNRER